MTGQARHRLRGALVAGQIAMALMLLAGAGLMINSFFRLTGADLGCNPAGVITFDYDYPVSQYINIVGSYHNYPLFDSSPVPAQNFDRLLERIRNMPGVQSAAGSVYPLMQGGEDSMTFSIQGRPASAKRCGEKRAERGLLSGDGQDLFTTLHVPLLRGRDFTARDSAAAPWVAIINQTMARTFWPNEDPIGKHVTLDLVPDERPREIIASCET